MSLENRNKPQLSEAEKSVQDRIKSFKTHEKGKRMAESVPEKDLRKVQSKTDQALQHIEKESLLEAIKKEAKSWTEDKGVSKNTLFNSLKNGVKNVTQRKILEEQKHFKKQGFVSLIKELEVQI